MEIFAIHHDFVQNDLWRKVAITLHHNLYGESIKLQNFHLTQKFVTFKITIDSCFLINCTCEFIKWKKINNGIFQMKKPEREMHIY